MINRTLAHFYSGLGLFLEDSLFLGLINYPQSDPLRRSVPEWFGNPSTELPAAHMVEQNGDLSSLHWPALYKEFKQRGLGGQLYNEFSF